MGSSEVDREFTERVSIGFVTASGIRIGFESDLVVRPTELVVVDAAVPRVPVLLAATLLLTATLRLAATASDASVFFTIVTADFGVGIVGTLEIEFDLEPKPEAFVAGTTFFFFPGK